MINNIDDSMEIYKALYFNPLITISVLQNKD